MPDGLKLIKKPGCYDFDIDQPGCDNGGIRMELNFRVKNIPAAALLMLTVWEGKTKTKPRGWAGMRLFGYDRIMAHGEHELKLCPYYFDVNPSSTTIDGSRLRTPLGGIISTIKLAFDENMVSNSKRRRACIAYMESTVVDISILPPSFKPVSLSLSCIFSILKQPKQVFFNPIKYI